MLIPPPSPTRPHDPDGLRAEVEIEIEEELRQEEAALSPLLPRLDVERALQPALIAGADPRLEAIGARRPRPPVPPAVAVADAAPPQGVENGGDVCVGTPRVLHAIPGRPIRRDPTLTPCERRGVENEGLRRPRLQRLADLREEEVRALGAPLQGTTAELERFADVAGEVGLVENAVATGMVMSCRLPTATTPALAWDGRSPLDREGAVPPS